MVIGELRTCDMGLMSTNQHKALDALEKAGGALGYTGWRDASGIAKGSFGRVRRALLDKVLVVEEGGRHRLTSMSSDACPSPTDTTNTSVTKMQEPSLDMPNSPIVGAGIGKYWTNATTPDKLVPWRPKR